MSAIPRRHELRNRVHLDVARALVDGANLRIAVELLDAEALGEADAAQELDAFGGDALGGISST